MQDKMRGKAAKRYHQPAPFLAVLCLLVFMLSALPVFAEEDASRGAASLSSSGSSVQQQPSGLEAPVTVLAQNYEHREKRIFASGNVEIHYKDIKLLADEIEVNTETKDVFARGNVVIVMPDEVVSGDSVFYNLDSHQGKIERASGMVQPTIFYRAETIERKTEGVYGLTQARLTSCTQPTPRWNFSCSRANFKKDDYVEMWDSVFRIKNVPVFYLPYFRYPLDRERSTGFLMPQVGYSGVKGFFFGQSFYWAIARNMDATFSLDYYSAKGVGGGLEYRYLFRGGTGGEARVYYFLFSENQELGKIEQTGQPGQPENAYLVRFKHNQPLPFGFSLVANIDYQTSFDFLREFNNDIKLATIANLRSEAYISKAWSSFSFSARASRSETIFTELDSSVITYYKPQISFNSFKIKLFSPLYFSFDSSFTSWKHGWKSDFDAGTERYNDALRFTPTLTLPFSAIPWLTINSSFTSNLSYSAQSLEPGTGQIIDEPMTLFNHEFRVDLTGPVFYRIFESGGGETRIKHLIEPFVTFRYESPVSHPERVVTTYGFFRTHQVSYGVTNRILVKTDMPREVFAWGVSQTYYLSPEDSSMSFYRWEGEIPSRSDIGSYVRFYPARKYSFDVSAAYNTYVKTFSFLRLGASLNSPADPLFLQVNWFRSINPWFKDILGDRQQVGAVGRLNMPRLNFDVLAQFDYNIEKRRMLYTGLSLIYHYQCLDFKADVRVFYYREKPETQVRFSIGLGNIGKTTDFLGGLGF